MNNETKIIDDQLKKQIEAYRSEKQNHYNIYAIILKRTLENACAINLPEAIVQSRPKSVDSFAEKCVRKADKYRDAVHDMTDLCGARVIVQTLDQVDAVRTFIRGSFDIVEEDVKGAAFADAEFGYRDVHYIIRLRPDRCAALGISDEEKDVIGDRCAELQVRTWMQHAWADTLHDRMYKTKLKYPREFRRVAGLLAALMEDGDRSFNILATDIDGMLANYNAYASRLEVENEIGRQKQILANIEEAKRPRIALQLGRLMIAQGRYAEAVDALNAHEIVPGPLLPEIVMDLGYALCKLNRADPANCGYVRGLSLLEKAVTLFEASDPDMPVNIRKRNSLLARALARKGWALEPLCMRAFEARSCYQAALEYEPGNPYHLSDVIGHEIHCTHEPSIVNSMRAPIRAALQTCREHMENGTEMPYACFVAGRLRLLLGEDNDALNSYALGIARFLSCDTCCAPDILDMEEGWILRVVGSEQARHGYEWALRLLGLARRIKDGRQRGPETAVDIESPVLLVAGGADTLNDAKHRNRILPLLKRVFADLRGTVVSGGTDCGVPGCVGEVAASLGPDRSFRLIGFRPRLLPDDAPADKRYDQQVISGEENFTPAQVIHSWEMILDAGIEANAVRLLGYGGGAIAAFEYRVALALGASVGIVEDSGGAADVLLRDQMWSSMLNLLPLPHDPETLRAFAHPAEKREAFTESAVDAMAQAFHANYVAGSQGKLPPTLRSWEKLEETYKTANREQARYAVKILEACGFVVRASANPVVFDDFTDDEIEQMAEMEHGRWNIERLHNGWRHGERDDAQKLHNCLVPWTDENTLTEEIKGYDRESVRKFSEILAMAGLEIQRPMRAEDMT